MPDPTLKTTFVSDDKSTTDALARMQKETSQLRDQLKQLRDESHAHHKESEEGWGHVGDAIKEQGGELASMFLAYGSIEGAIEGISSAMEQWNEKLKKAGELGEKLTTDFNKMLGKQVQGAAAPQVQKFLETLPGVTEAEGLQIYGATSAAGGRLTESEREEIAMAVAPLVKSAIDADAVAREASLLKAQFHGVTGEQARDLVLKVTEQVGADGAAAVFEKTTLGAAGRLVDSGAMDMTTAIAKAAALENVGLGARVLDKERAVIEAKPKKLRSLRRGQSYTEEEEAEQAFAGMSATAKAHALDTDPDLAGAKLGENVAGKLRQIGADQAKYDQLFRNPAGAAEEHASGLEATIKGKKFVEAHSQSVAIDKMESTKRERGEFTNTAEAALEAELGDENKFGFVSSMAVGWSIAAKRKAYQASGQSGDDALISAVKDVNKGGADSMLPFGGSFKGIFDNLIKHFDDMHETMKEAVEHIKAGNSDKAAASSNLGVRGLHSEH